ncbi:MAG: hypothetical protein KGI03_02430 [Patescibacteria group bacterium]|nr:hypothetical protein [Patescibacteria group bacterium]
MRRKMRLAGFDADFRRSLDETGHAKITWRYARYNADGSVDIVEFEATRIRSQEENSYLLRCFGTKAAYAIDRVNKTFLERAFQEARQKSVAARHSCKNRRIPGKNAYIPAPQQVRKRRLPHPAPIGKDKERIVWQYQHNVVTWREAVAATVFVFERRGDWKSSAAQLAARELFESFDASGHRFAQIKRDGFTLRFDRIRPVVDEDWIWGPEQERFFDTTPKSRLPADPNLLWKRFEDTLFSVWCTKDNNDLRYRRLRDHFRPILVALPGGRRQQRRMLLAGVAMAA